MAKSSTRRVNIYINNKEVKAPSYFEFFVSSPPPKPLPMNRCRPYRFVHPLRGCVNTRGNAIGYRYASPNGDEWRNQHLGARHVSATTPPRWEDYRHTVFTAPPPQCADATTTLHSPFSILNSSFSHTFSAKERDTETGLSYFGSRYYSSDLSIWLSVDPMSGKYPHQSNYVYCSNNPIKIVDPDGDDEWEVNEITGRIKHYSNDRPDKLFVTTADGQRKDDISPLDVDRTIMGQILSDETQTAFTAMNKREEFNKMFDYLADNTFVEWSHIGVSYYIEDKYGGTTNTFDMLFTRHQFTSCNLRGNLENFVGSGVLDFHKHSHPNKYLGLNPYYKAVYTMTSHIPSRNDLANKNSYPFQGIPFKSYFLLRNGKRNIIY